MNINLPDVERIRVEDFKDPDENMTKLIKWVTRFSEPVFTLISAITKDNAKITLYTYTFNKITTAQLPLTFTPNTDISGLWVSKATEVSGNYTIVGSAVFPDWYQNGNSVTISGLTGLNPAKSYNLTVVYI